MSFEAIRGEDLSLEAEVLLDSFEVSLDVVSLPIMLKDLPIGQRSVLERMSPENNIL